MKKQIILLLLVSAMFWIGTVAQAAIIVGRIGHVEGDIYRYMDVGNEWVQTFVDSPAGTGDILSTGAGSRAEINFPNQLVVRLAENAEVEIINLEEDIGEFYLVAGLARFYNNSSTGTLKIRTNRGVLNLPAGSIADLQADATSIQIWSVRGGPTFLAMASDSRTETLEVIDQSTSLTIYRNSVAAGIGPIDRGWHNWCAERENVWHERQLVRSEYMPEPLQEYAYVLQPHGRWRRVYSRGYYYWAWKPHRVAAGWAPYTSGYWYDWHGDRVWVDHNPWGWVTHHHGQWMHVHGSWMWTPYVHVAATPGVTVTSFSIVFGPRYRPHWHPGRVRWIANNDYVGWLPLAPWETYYGHRRWGPGSRVAYSSTGVNIRININLADHHYLDHAVVIPRHHFKHRGPAVVKNYNTIKIKNINRNIIARNYRQLPTLEERKHKKRKQVVKDQIKSRRRVISKHRKVDTKKVVITQKKHRSRKVDGSVLSKANPRRKARIATAGKRIENPVRITGKKTVSRKQRTVTTRRVVQGERVSYLDKKGKRTTAKRDDKRVETKINRKRIISERHQVARQEKTVKKGRRQKLKKDQKRWKTDEEYAVQDKQKRNGRYNYSRQQEIGSRNELKRMDRRERYSMNHSGFTASSSLSRRRGRL
jgi:hypothetical protein